MDSYISLKSCMGLSGLNLKVFFILMLKPVEHAVILMPTFFQPLPAFEGARAYKEREPQSPWSNSQSWYGKPVSAQRIERVVLLGRISAEMLFPRTRGLSLIKFSSRGSA